MDILLFEAAIVAAGLLFSMDDDDEGEFEKYAAASKDMVDSRARLV